MAQEIALALHDDVVTRDGWYAAGDVAVAWCTSRPTWFAWQTVRETWPQRRALPNRIPTLENPCACGQIERLARLGTAADTIVHAGYQDCTGQLAIDQWLRAAGLLAGALRLWTDCLDRAALRARNEALLPVEAFDDLSRRAQVREQIDALQRMVCAQLWGYDVDVAEWVVLEQLDSPGFLVPVAPGGGAGGDLPDTSALLELGRRALGVGGATVLHLAIGLYETGAIGYPRTACRTVGAESVSLRQVLADRMVERFPDLSEIAADMPDCGMSACGNARNDHLHAVTPTPWLGKLAPMGPQGALLHALSRQFLSALAAARTGHDDTTAMLPSGEARLARRVASRLGVDERTCWWVALVLEDLQCRRMIERRRGQWWTRSARGEEFIRLAPAALLQSAVVVGALTQAEDLTHPKDWERRQREWLAGLLRECEPAPRIGYMGCAAGPSDAA